MDDLLNNLKKAREELGKIKEAQKQRLDAFQQSQEWTVLQLARLGYETDIVNFEAEIKDAALADYATTQDKHPRSEIEIKLFKVVDILNDVAAREWCFLNFRPALKLDTKTFEKAAKDGSIPAELATVSEEPRVQIATRL